ncbi:hypothetical protein RhiJN_05783 [Ceratobasidium sp. AG-Ba]|nr:hypothetical protein RhiJN_05783 [Ceratobasidium sp. AG-Ba]
MVSLTKREQHQVRQQLEHAEAQKRKAERRATHERRMHQQAEEAARARVERARRHQALKEEEARRRRAKEARRGYPSSTTSSSSHSSWTEYDFGARTSTLQAHTAAKYWEREGVARYETGWERMRQVIGANQATLTFSDIPWPTLHRINSLDQLSRESIEHFILSEFLARGKDTRVVLRNFILQWHPDKFLGRLV